MNFMSLFERHVGTVTARQTRFADFLGDDYEWNADLAEGVIVFNHTTTYPIQLLGSESETDHHWLWAWANDGLSRFDKVQRFSEQLRRFGQDHEVGAFTNPGFPVTETINGHTLAILCTGVEKWSCYLRGPYDGGAIFCLVQDLPDTLFTPLTLKETLSTVELVVSTFEGIRHRNMLEHFLADQGFELEPDGIRLRAVRDNDFLVARFDEQERLVECRRN
ncbi:MAG: hypothetical protein LBL59_07935 [Xanthomonadaceae bacterium]|jgi:hypothetical protein|nr:hypothetical protein [Xanthomonadaceae bacterium]